MALPYSIQCSGCGEVRVGRRVGDEVRPYRETCPDCGETAFVVPWE